MIPKCWIATFTLIFMIRHKQFRGTIYTTVNSNILGPPMISSERSFMTHSLSNVILKWTQVITSYFGSGFQTFGAPLFKLCNIFPFPKITINWLWLLFTFFNLGNSQYSMSNGAIIKNFNGINFINPTLNFSNKFWTLS